MSRTPRQAEDEIKALLDKLGVQYKGVLVTGGVVYISFTEEDEEEAERLHSQLVERDGGKWFMSQLPDGEWSVSNKH